MRRPLLTVSPSACARGVLLDLEAWGQCRPPMRECSALFREEAHPPKGQVSARALAVRAALLGADERRWCGVVIERRLSSSISPTSRLMVRTTVSRAREAVRLARTPSARVRKTPPSVVPWATDRPCAHSRATEE